MSAFPENSLKHKIDKLGVIAGGGDVPERLLQACDQIKQDVFVVGFEGQTNPRLMENRNYMMTRLGAAGQIISALKTHDVKDLVLIGSIKRPTMAELKPDMRTAKFFAKLGFRALGDDGLLKALRHELEQEGFSIHGVQDFVEDLLVKEGLVGKYKPKKADGPSIERGIEASQMIGRFDIGQSVIVQDGIVLGVEGAEGTDELIRRCAKYKREGRGGILVKTCKPQQDRDLDLPTIGPETVRLCADTGLVGIIVHAGKSILMAPKDIIEIADEQKIFVSAVNINEADHAT